MGLLHHPPPYLPILEHHDRKLLHNQASHQRRTTLQRKILWYFDNDLGIVDMVTMLSRFVASVYIIVVPPRKSTKRILLVL